MKRAMCLLLMLLPPGVVSAQSAWSLVTTSNGWQWKSPSGATVQRYIAASKVDDADISRDGSSYEAALCNKYGGTYNGTDCDSAGWNNWQQAMSARLLNLGFTAAGQFSYKYAEYWNTGTLPYAPTENSSVYVMDDNHSYHVKDAYWIPYRSGMQCGSNIWDGSEADPYDPNAVAGYKGVLSGLVTTTNVARAMIVVPDEGDLAYGIDTNDGRHADFGYVILANAPFQKVSRGDRYAYTGGKYTFTDQTRYAKLALRDFLLNEYLCTAAGMPVPTCTGAGDGTGSADPASPSYVGATNAANALAALNAAWDTSYTTWNTSDANGLPGIKNGTYTSWGGVAACQSAGVPYAGCTGAGTGSGITQGTGLLDEAGFGVLTNTANCLGTGRNGPSNIDSWSNVPQIETDLHAFIQALAAKYAYDVRQGYLNMCPSCAALPPEALVIYDGPNYAYAGAAPYTDLFWVHVSTGSSESELISDLQRIIDNDGDHPLISADYTKVNGSDSWFGTNGGSACSGPECFATQDSRGAFLNSYFKQEVQLTNPSEKHPVIGLEHWSLYDKATSGGMGLFTPNDNAYDGSEASTLSGAQPNCATSHTYLRPAICLDSNGDFQSLTGTGTNSCTSGNTAPTWPSEGIANLYSLTTDGNCHWFDIGPYSLTPESANYTDVLSEITSVNHTLGTQPAKPTMYGTPQTAWNETSGTSSITTNLPNGGASVSAYTIYLIQAADRAGNPIFTAPPGWTQICQVSPDSSDQEQVFYQVVAPGSAPPSSVTLTVSRGWNWAGVIAVAYQNFNTSAPFDGACQTASTTAGSPAVGASTTTSASNDLVIWNFFVNNNTGTTSPSVSQGTTQAQVTRSELAAYGYLNYTDRLLLSPGSSGTNSLSWSGSATIAGAASLALSPQ